MRRPSAETSAISLSPSSTPIRLADAAGRRTARLLPHRHTTSSTRAPLDAIAPLRRISMYIHRSRWRCFRQGETRRDERLILQPSIRAPKRSAKLRRRAEEGLLGHIRRVTDARISIDKARPRVDGVIRLRPPTRRRQRSCEADYRSQWLRGAARRAYGGKAPQVFGVRWRYRGGGLGTGSIYLIRDPPAGQSKRRSPGVNCLPGSGPMQPLVTRMALLAFGAAACGWMFR